MRRTVLPTPERLRDCLYQNEAGELVWKITRARARTGKIAGRINKDGYVAIRLDRVEFLAHRAVIAMHTGRWTSQDLDVDHVNGIKTDNRIENLRECTDVENMQNYPTPKSNSSGFVGVYWNSKIGKWTAQIRVGLGGGNKRRITIGHFANVNDAAAAQAAKKAELHTFNPITRDGIYANKAA